MEGEKTVLRNESDVMPKRLKEAEEEVSRVDVVKKMVQNEEVTFLENCSETWHSLNGISESLQFHSEDSSLKEDDYFVNTKRLPSW